MSVTDITAAHGWSWAFSPLLPNGNCKLPQSDGFQTHCVWLPFAEFHKGVICYREANYIDCPKSDEPTLYGLRRSYGLQGWMHCNVDLAQTTLFLDLEGFTYGEVKLGLPDPANYIGKGLLPVGRHIQEAMTQRTEAEGGTHEQVLENGTSVRYSVHYDVVIVPDVSSSDDDDSEYFFGMSWLCVHEIRLPIACLRRGVSSTCI